MHPKISGSPDIFIRNTNTAVFLHGCFWHKCPKCYKEPKSRKEYWLPKLKRNVERDKENLNILKKQGCNVLVLWEHDVKKDFSNAANKIKKFI